MRKRQSLLKSIGPLMGAAGVLGGMAASCGTGGGKVVDNNAKLTSTSLNVSASALRERDLRKLAGTITACSSSSTRCTPGNLSGDLCYALLGMGKLGGEFFSMTWLAPESTFPDGPESGTCSSVDFDLSSATTFSGQIKVPSSEGEMPSTAEIIRAELMYNYVDTKFKLAGAGSVTDGEYTVRTVYSTSATASDVTGTMEKGDKLVKGPSDTQFKWCNSGGCDASRTAVATGLYQDSTVTGYVHPSDGNSDYVNVTANFLTSVPVTYSQITDSSKVWTLDFSATNAIVWGSAPSTFASIQEMVQKFRLKFGPNQSTTNGEEDDGIRASLTIQ